MAGNIQNNLQKDIKNIYRRLGKLGDVQSFLAEARSSLDSIKADASGSTQIVQNVKANLQISTDTLEQAKTQANEVSAIKQTVLEGQAVLEEQKIQVAQLESRADETIKKVEEKSQVLEGEISKVAELREEVKTQLLVTTGGTLAKAFEKKQGQLVTSSRIWAIIFFGVATLLTFAAYAFVGEIVNGKFPNPTNALLKASVLLPLTYAMYLSASILRRNRELEEEYSFKSAVAFSLAAYQKILTDLKDISTDEKVTQFLTDSITGIYTPPKRKYWQIRDRESDIVSEVVKELESLNLLSK